MSSITIKSGTVSVEDTRFSTLINVIIDKAIRNAFQEIIKENSDYVQTVAMDTGDMRKAHRSAIAQEVRRVPIHRGKSEFKWSNIKDFTTKRVDYAQYHFRGRGYYKNPTTPNTYPMRFSRLKPMLKTAIQKNIDEELKKHGLSHRANWSIT